MTATLHTGEGSNSAPLIDSGSQFHPDEATVLLKALWRSPHRVHYVVARDPVEARFLSESVGSVSDATGCALAWANAGLDAYVACAEYATPFGRTAGNATGAFAFWLDVDCGEQKAANGSGYRTVEEALSALKRFFAVTGLPMPTHIVESGIGLHVYSVLDQSVGRERWQQFARKFKQLNQACGFRSDGSRTADIASLMRVPGTFNQKYEPPRPVRLVQASANFIETAVMLDAIESAHRKFCGKSVLPARGQAGAGIGVAPPDGAVRRSLGLTRLASALAVLDPDCDDETWKLRRLAPLADAAQSSPELADALCDLAMAWSSGSLRGTPSHKWKHPGGCGRTGEQVFTSVWTRFRTSNYSGQRTTVRTIFHDAAEAGWSGVDTSDQFQVVDDSGVHDA